MLSLQWIISDYPEQFWKLSSWDVDMNPGEHEGKLYSSGSDRAAELEDDAEDHSHLFYKSHRSLYD